MGLNNNFHPLERMGKNLGLIGRGEKYYKHFKEFLTGKGGIASVEEETKET